MVRLADIAEKLNLSLTTVSRALNDYSEVSRKTKELVRKAAKEMEYVPNSSARSLALKKSHLISLFCYDYGEPISYQSFNFEVIAGIKNYFGNTLYDLIIVPERPKHKSRESLKNICYSRGFDGLFVVGIRTDDPYLEELKEDFIPAVVIDYPLTGRRISYVESDNIKGCRLAIDYLVSKGHKNIAFINGHSFAAVSSVRLHGYKLALEKNGIQFSHELAVVSDYSEEGGYNSTQRLLQEKGNISAIFTASDIMAVGAIKALRDRKLKVPEDVAVIGFDDIFFAEYAHPGLTTIRQHKFDMGYQGSQLLQKIIEQPDYIPKRKRINVELIIRDSA